MKINKKGWIRIVEATIAILIIISVLLSISKIRQNKLERDLSENINPLLTEIAKNTTTREIILEDNDSSFIAESTIRNFVTTKLKVFPYIENNVTICGLNESCGYLEFYPSNVKGNVYAGFRIISSVLTNTKPPKKVNLFLWIKE
jgi:hypothetical protein